VIVRWVLDIRRVAVQSSGILACLVSLGLSCVADASAREAWWRLSSGLTPTRLAPGQEGRLSVTAINLGDAAVNATRTPVTVTDILPAGLEATEVRFTEAGHEAIRGELECSTPLPAASVTCMWSGPEPLQPYEALDIAIEVKAQANAPSTGENEVAVSGGESYRCETVASGSGQFTSPFCRIAQQGTGDFEGVFSGSAISDATFKQPTRVEGGVTSFGAEDFRMSMENEGGSPDLQAGSHPFQLTTRIRLNQTADRGSPPADPKDLRIKLPAGLVGNATALPQCTEAQFSTTGNNAVNLCSAGTVVGAVSVSFFFSNSLGAFNGVVVPVYNLVPAPGEPARFGFELETVPVVLDTSVRTGEDYGVTVTVPNVSQAVNILSTWLTLWGVPGDPRHNLSRGTACLGGGFRGEFGVPCISVGEPQAPLLTLPGSCTGPTQAILEGDSWPVGPGPRHSLTFEGIPSPMGSLEGCEHVPFDPSLSVAPDVPSASTPTGLTVHVDVPQEAATNPTGVAPANLKDATVTLPEGLTLNPAAAGGLQACSEAQIGFQRIAGDGTALFTPGVPSCPDASKVGIVQSRTPLLANPLEGSVYLAAQGENPFGSLVALYLVAQDPVSGVLVKLVGEVALDPVTGRVVTTFKNTPQVPFEDLELHFFGGPRAALSNPAGCGTFTTSASFTPWSGNPDVNTSSSFQITSGAGGGGCPGQALFAPSFTAGTTNNQAGGFSPFTVTFSRQDQEQDLSGVSVTTPPGLLGLLKSVQQCGEPQAAQGACGAASLIGHTTATSGAGPDPVSLTGQVFLTGPYKGAPFGLSIVVPAVAGPFNLGNVVVRAAIHVDPHTAQITVVSDPLPTILQGVPVQIRTVNVSIDREGFMFNPTNCEPLSVGGTLSSTQGASANVSSHFQAANCAALPFKPSFTVSTQANTSKKNGASLDVKVGYPQGAQANIRSVAVTLPKQLPSRLSTIQQACPEATFNANPASCPAGSNIGIGTARTPVLANPVTGPAYLVSHGGAAFPDLVLILQGEGVTLDLVGSINIKKSITSSTFASVPDAPISSFELSLPEGPHSGLAAVLPAKAKGSLCGTSLTMPTAITGQNGAQIKQSTKIAVTGCPKAKKKAKRRKHPTKAGGKKG
jgi:uncharacterized repeat protein (TIGR01451 family)